MHWAKPRLLMPCRAQIHSDVHKSQHAHAHTQRA